MDFEPDLFHTAHTLSIHHWMMNGLKAALKRRTLGDTVVKIGNDPAMCICPEGQQYSRLQKKRQVKGSGSAPLLSSCEI